MVVGLGKLGAEEIAFGIQCGEFVALRLVAAPSVEGHRLISGSYFWEAAHAQGIGRSGVPPWRHG